MHDLFWGIMTTKKMVGFLFLFVINLTAEWLPMQQWQQAVEACTEALKIDPEFERAKNNLHWARDNLKQ